MNPEPSQPFPRQRKGGGRERATWLVLAAGGPAADLAGHVPDAVVRVTADPGDFRDALLSERPGVVVCAQPPAGAEDLELVASERRRRRGMRTLYLSPPDAVASRLEALAAGFDDALLTTTPVAELAGRLGMLVAGGWSRQRADPVIVVAPGLQLDMAAHELRRDGRVVHLRPKEFGLLAMLASHPGQAFTRGQLLDRVWGSDRQGGARTVDVHVRWLRSKIEPEPEHPVRLVTVRGVGYRLDGPQR